MKTYVQVWVCLLALSYVHLEQVGVQDLWVPEIHDLIQELIDQREIFANLLLAEFPIEVTLAEGDQRVKKLHEKGGIRIGFCRSKQSDVILSVMHEGHTIQE